MSPLPQHSADERFIALLALGWVAKFTRPLFGRSENRTFTHTSLMMPPQDAVASDSFFLCHGPNLVPDAAPVSRPKVKARAPRR